MTMDTPVPPRYSCFNQLTTYDRHNLLDGIWLDKETIAYMFVQQGGELDEAAELVMDIMSITSAINRACQDPIVALTLEDEHRIVLHPTMIFGPDRPDLMALSMLGLDAIVNGPQHMSLVRLVRSKQQVPMHNHAIHRCQKFVYATLRSMTTTIP